jgi:hypothetical protein
VGVGVRVAVGLAAKVGIVVDGNSPIKTPVGVDAPASNAGVSLLEGTIPGEQLLRKTVRINTRGNKRAIEQDLLFGLVNNTEFVRFRQRAGYILDRVENRSKVTGVLFYL